LYFTDEIEKETNNPKLIVRSLDLSSQKSIRQFADEIHATESHIDVLIHNAGISIFTNTYDSVDDIEVTMATNHYGPFLLTHLLIDLLKKASPSRIVVVASSIYKLCPTYTIDRNPRGAIFPIRNYFNSKLANIMFTQELARRLEGTGVTANCLHPGIVDSDIWNFLGFPLSYAVRYVVGAFFKTLKEGAETTIYVATDKDLVGVTGKYFKDCAGAELWSGAANVDIQRNLWKDSVEMVNLSEKEQKLLE
jgi:NAD(P)-dependent dehydrogenase (short-subunit alcohol dehydrogenase family)